MLYNKNLESKRYILISIIVLEKKIYSYINKLILTLGYVDNWVLCRHLLFFTRFLHSASLLAHLSIPTCLNPF